jgi:uncharacterized pyridoxamine 5'-phosphate oxidase family protein
MAESGQYSQLREQAAAFLAEKRAIALATCVDNDVRVRTISFASRGLEIFFLTFEHNLKCQQIRANPNVALCRDNVQVEGRATIIGRVDDPFNEVYANLLRKKYPATFDADATRPGMVIVLITPRWVRIFRNPEGCYVVDSLDLLEEAVTSADLAGP